MTTINTADIAAGVLGEERVRPLLDHCVEQVLHVFARDDQQVLLESVGRDGSFIDEPEGRVVNPGHSLESMWFCIEEGKKRGDRSIVDRAMTVAAWAWQRGYDAGHGGVVSFLDSGGGEPLQTDWHRETGLLWHDKVWWVHAEALYATALCAIESGSEEWSKRFLGLHEWCQQHFYDSEYGEWYAELSRDGTVKLSDKATLWKSAYHLPRALMMLAKLFEDSSDEGVRSPG